MTTKSPIRAGLISIGAKDLNKQNPDGIGTKSKLKRFSIFARVTVGTG